MKDTDKSWIVGVDLRERSAGAVRFASWLARSCAVGRAPALHGVHVIESAQFAALRQFGPRAEIESRVAAAVEETIARAGAAGAFARTSVIEHRRADVSIGELAEGTGASAIVIGRRSGAHDGALVRLGTVARRVLRALRRPTIVVPPDLEIAEIGDGPVVVAAIPGASLTGAVRFASRLAADLGRELVCVHVVKIPLDYSQLYWSDAALGRHREGEMRAAREDIEAWLTELGCGHAHIELLHGVELDTILSAAERHHAPLLVTGSRRLGGIERIVLASVSRELAAHASGPVAIVAPDHVIA